MKQSNSTSIDIASYQAIKVKMIEQRLEALLPSQQAAYSQLIQAAHYALMSGGKRLRPLLTLAVNETLGGSVEKALNAACAIEMIHTYSLIHDDLPCMDDDDFRRGKPSVHKAFSEGHAVLTGDYLLTYAFEVIAQDCFLRAEQKIQLIALLAKKSGAQGMIGGQVMDIEAEGVTIDLDSLLNIHQHKTGALMTASIEFGAIIADASPEECDLLQSFGDTVGLAYQIIDDVIDVSACQKKHGKAASSDSINNKTTYVTLLGIESAQQKAHELLDEALSSLSNLCCDTSLLRELANRLICRKI